VQKASIKDSVLAVPADPDDVWAYGSKVSRFDCCHSPIFGLALRCLNRPRAEAAPLGAEAPDYDVAEGQSLG
jgi:hypothetical protein